MVSIVLTRIDRVFKFFYFLICKTKSQSNHEKKKKRYSCGENLERIERIPTHSECSCFINDEEGSSFELVDQ